VSGPFTEDQRRAVADALDAAVPGSAAAGALGYVEQLLGALDHEPPRIWAAPGPWSGGAGGWLELGPWERQAWAQRLADWRAAYERVADGRADAADLRLVHVHACEATYGDPAYGGNRDEAGWRRIDFPTPVFPPSRGQR
jgi:hypothetical protein